MFLAKNVADWLELTNTTDMVSRVDEDEVAKFNLGSQSGETWFLSESGIYEILMQSRKPIAKEFKKGVKKILKELRLKGSVTTRPMTLMEMVAAQANAMVEQERNKKGTFRKAKPTLILPSVINFSIRYTISSPKW